jgi:hypothetical protein
MSELDSSEVSMSKQNTVSFDNKLLEMFGTKHLTAEKV